MPNIMVFGRLSFKVSDQIARIVLGLGISPADVILTEMPEAIITDLTNRDMPYLVVRDTDSERCQEIARALNQELNVDVEVEVITDFFPKRGEVFSKQEPE